MDSTSQRDKADLFPQRRAECRVRCHADCLDPYTASSAAHETTAAVLWA